eukprot:7090586-Karenia_brevis.AAC.1
MSHDQIAISLRQRGVEPNLVAAFMRELQGVHGIISLPGAGSTKPFPFCRGGKQGGVDTPD